MVNFHLGVKMVNHDERKSYIINSSKIKLKHISPNVENVVPKNLNLMNFFNGKL